MALDRRNYRQVCALQYLFFFLFEINPIIVTLNF